MENFSADVLAYLHEHRHTDIVKLLLKKSPFTNVSMETIVRQIQGRKIAAEKFPILLDYPQYRYPRKLSLEQSSSQQTAKYKRSLMEGKRFADLTGGMGIDSYFLGQEFEECLYIEPNENLYHDTLLNFKLLDHPVKGFQGTSEEWLTTASDNPNQEKYDWIYLDPSRRTEGNRKTSIENYEPNIIELRNDLLDNAHHVMIKLSPMQDISECVTALHSIQHIYIISIKNDVKELLIHLTSSENQNPMISAIDLSDIEQIVTANFLDRLSKPTLTSTQSYIYQPAPTLIKSGLHDHHANQLALNKIHPNTQLYTSDDLLDSYFGRIFRVIKQISSSKKKVRKELPYLKANIISKNYPLSPSQIANKLDISDGGNQYILAYTDMAEQRVLMLCERLG